MKKIAIALATNMRRTIQAKMSITDRSFFRAAASTRPQPRACGYRTGRARGKASFFRVDDLPPGVIRIELAHARRDPACSRAEVLFEHVTVVVDDEGHDAGVAVLGRVGDEPETADHAAANDVVDGATGRTRTLLCQDLEIVAVVRFTGANAITLARRGGNRRHESTLWG